MLIKSFTKELEDIDDIKNITNKNRYIFIYKYDAPHQCTCQSPFGYFNGVDDWYDIYLINDSVVEGIDYLIPRGVTLWNRNAYRGYAKGIINPDGSFNKNAIITFTNGSFLNRVKPKINEDTPYEIYSSDIIACCGSPGGTVYEDELMSTLHTEVIQPFPKFYNIEDQARLKSRNDKMFVGDFTYDYTECPVYTLRELTDKYTKVAKIDIPSNYNLIDLSVIDDPTNEISLDPWIKLNNGVKIDGTMIKNAITKLYLIIYDAVYRSIFSSVDVIVDIESGIFNVIPKCLKFSNVTKKEISYNTAKISNIISEEMDNFSELIEDVPDAIFINNLSPNRITFNIGNYDSTIKLSNIYHMIGVNEKTKQPECIHAMDRISASDSDEMSRVYASGLGFAGGNYVN